MNEGVCLAIEVDEARARRRVEIGYVDRLTHDPAEALALGARRRRRDGEAVSIALVGNAAEIEPAWAAAGERFDIVTDQTSAHDALGGYVPAEIGLADALDPAREPARRIPAPVPRGDGRPCSGDARVPARWRGRLRLRQQPSGPGPGGGRRRRVRLPGLRARPSSGRSSARAVARSAGRRCPATRPTSRAPTGRSSSCSPTTPASAAGSRWPQARVPFQGLPARICWLGLRRAVARRSRLQRAGRIGRGQRSDRHRARPPRRRLGRLPEPRDRGDGRWHRRGRRLAAAQRARQHGRRRVVGFDPPRRRRRDRLLAARRDGRRRRRQRRSPPRSSSAS